VTAASALDDARRTARRAAHSDALDWLARAGFVARGVVYGVIGLIAFEVARDGGRGDDASKEGALREIAERRFGGVLLVVLAVGLAGYALWRATEAIWGKRDEQDERKRTLKRLGSAARALFYGAFLVTTVSFISSGPRASSGSSDQEEQTLVARVLDVTGGPWIVGAAGVAVIGAALYIGYRGLSQKFDERLDTSDMGPVTGAAVDVLGTVGMGARSLVFGIAGYLLIRAAIDHQPDEAGGLDATLKTMARAGFGQVLLVVTAVGLLAYGLYSFAEARYRQL
jgi:uncharacterized membrane protein YidH (DUF202 family)